MDGEVDFGFCGACDFDAEVGFEEWLHGLQGDEEVGAGEEFVPRF